MTKNDFIQNINEKIKLIRTEKNYSQDKMAEILGISKKTLVEIEKGRSSFNWSGAVSVAALFNDSEIIQMLFGDDVLDTIKTIAFTSYNENLPKTMGGKIWWRLIAERDGFKIQQNVISQHYRLLDWENRRICSSMDLEYIEKRLSEMRLAR
ncbi:MAG: helix-turn-helix transcriptional regulator [Desulfitobacteriia bacterium]|jgi:DNA-binding XRE family transcriptional regulator